MGQYHKVVNLDKHEYLHPHELGDGLKLMEQAFGGLGSVSSALMILLAVSNDRGGGDAHNCDLAGRWGGDRIAVVGDYAEEDDLQAEDDAQHIYDLCGPEEDKMAQVDHLREQAKRSRDRGYVSEASRLEAQADHLFRLPVYTNISSQVRQWFEEEEGVKYSREHGAWLFRTLD